MVLYDSVNLIISGVHNHIWAVGVIVLVIFIVHIADASKKRSIKERWLYWTQRVLVVVVQLWW